MNEINSENHRKNTIFSRLYSRTLWIPKDLTKEWENNPREVINIVTSTIYKDQNVTRTKLLIWVSIYYIHTMDMSNIMPSDECSKKYVELIYTNIFWNKLRHLKTWIPLFDLNTVEETASFLKTPYFKLMNFPLKDL